MSPAGVATQSIGERPVWGSTGHSGAEPVSTDFGVAAPLSLQHGTRPRVRGRHLHLVATENSRETFGGSQSVLTLGCLAY